MGTASEISVQAPGWTRQALPGVQLGVRPEALRRRARLLRKEDVCLNTLKPLDPRKIGAR